MIEFDFTVHYSGQNTPSLQVQTSIPSRGVTAIFGRSGSGKTTLLRCVAGLQTTTGGRLHIDGENWSTLPTHQRDIGYVFQESSLFEHLTAAGNLEYAARRSPSRPAAEDMQQVVSLLGLDSQLNQYPAELSGGERQRVAIARALIARPKLMLMDEPLASLDVERKQEILRFLDKVRETLAIPVLYVSHSLDEVTHLADHLVVIEKGRIVAEGPITEVLSRVDLPVRLGEDTGVVLEGEIIERDESYHLVRVAFAGGEIWLRDQGDDVGAPLRIRVLARDVSLALSSHQDTSIQNRLQATVVDIVAEPDAAMALVRLSLGESFIISRLTRRSLEQLGIHKGQTLWAQIKSMAIVR